MLTAALGTSTASALLAADGLVFMMAFLGGTYVSWWAVGILKWDKFVYDPFGRQARMLRFLLALLGGFLIGLIALVYIIAVQSMRILA